MILVSPQSQWDLDLDFGLLWDLVWVFRGLDLGLGLGGTFLVPRYYSWLLLQIVDSIKVTISCESHTLMLVTNSHVFVKP